MGTISVARAAHLIVYINLLHEIGAPIARELAQARLPTRIEETPDAYVCVQFALDFVDRSARQAPAADLGFLAAQRCSLDMLSRDLRIALLGCANGLAKIDALMRHAERENSGLVVTIARESSQVRVICDLVEFRNNPALIYGEWLALKVLISVVRAAAGPKWCPSEMTFMSRQPLCRPALEAYGNTRVLTGQPHTSILVPHELLAAPCSHHHVRSGEVTAAPNASVAAGDRFIATLRSAIQPYLGEGYPDLDLAAEIAGLSRRTLQRELARHGQTYSHVVSEARFQAACALLADSSIKIIEVAYATGYENPQHFSRAFRQLSGMSPRAYRSHGAGAP